MATSKRPRKRRVGGNPEIEMGEARRRLRQLPTEQLLQVHDALEAILNSDDLEPGQLTRLRRLLDRENS